MEDALQLVHSITSKNCKLTTFVWLKKKICKRMIRLFFICLICYLNQTIISNATFNVDTILVPNNTNDSNTVLFIFQGEDIPCEAYIPLGKSIQSAMNNTIFIAIPALPYEKALTDSELTGEIRGMMPKLYSYGL